MANQTFQMILPLRPWLENACAKIYWSRCTARLARFLSGLLFAPARSTDFATNNKKLKKPGYSCASNEANYVSHIWDCRDADGYAGATACIVIPWFAERFETGTDWRSLAWWVHDHLPYANMYFFPKLAAFNLTWHENPERRIDSYVAPKGCLTRFGMANHDGNHAEWYEGFPKLAH